MNFPDMNRIQSIATYLSAFMLNSVREWLHLAISSPLTLLQTTGKTKSLLGIGEAHSAMGHSKCGGEKDKGVRAPP